MPVDSGGEMVTLLIPFYRQEVNLPSLSVTPVLPIVVLLLR
jgi:hypothetical protein